MIVACVMTGDKYNERHVRLLRDGVRRWGLGNYEFVCISDRHIAGTRIIPAKLPGWWAKLQLFELREPLIYFDLDVVITDYLKPLVDWNAFGIIWDYLNPAEVPDNVIHTKMFNSSVMRLTGNEFHVWEQFCTKPEAVMSRYVRGGDQRWITARMPDAKTFPPAWFPSYRFDKCEDAVPPEALAVIFHGHPKPWDIPTGWVPRQLKGDVT
jgi:hypothetical protein